MKILDITGFKENTLESLHQAIVHAVKDSQRVLIQEHYSELLMTQAQYDLLQPDMDLMYRSDTYLYRTPLNIMEVRVKT